MAGTTIHNGREGRIQSRPKKRVSIKSLDAVSRPEWSLWRQRYIMTNSLNSTCSGQPASEDVVDKVSRRGGHVDRCPYRLITPLSSGRTAIELAGRKTTEHSVAVVFC